MRYSKVWWGQRGMAWQARLGEFRWGAFWSLGRGELRYGSFGFGLVRQVWCVTVWFVTFWCGMLRQVRYGY